MFTVSQSAQVQALIRVDFSVEFPSHLSTLLLLVRVNPLNSKNSSCFVRHSPCWRVIGIQSGLGNDRSSR